MAIAAAGKAALKAAAEVAKEIGEEVAKEGAQATKKALSDDLKKQIAKKLERDTLNLIDRNADPGDGTGTVTKIGRGAVEKMGKGKGQPGTGQIDINNLPIKDGPSYVKIDRPSNFPRETHGDEAIKKAEEGAINLVDGNADGGDGTDIATGALRGAMKKNELPGNNDVKITLPEKTPTTDMDMTPMDPGEAADKIPNPGEIGKDFEKPEIKDIPDINQPPIDKGDIPEVKFPVPEYIRSLVPRNDGMTAHPTTDVPFVREEFLDPDTGEIKEGSFPEFDSVFETNLPEGLYEASDSAQFAECNKQLQDWVEKNPDKAKEIFTEEQLDVIKNNPVEVKLPDGKTIVVWKNPPGLTWHHNQKPGLMQLVDSKIHAATGHTGGQAIWGNRSKDTTKE